MCIDREFGWTRVATITSKVLLWQDAGIAFDIVFKDRNITVAYTSEYEEEPTENYRIETLTKIKREARSMQYKDISLKHLFSVRTRATHFRKIVLSSP